MKELHLADGRKAIDVVLALAKEGKTRRQLSEQLGLTIEQTNHFRTKLIKKGLLEELSKEQKEQENLERRFNTSQSMGGLLRETFFYFQVGLSPMQIVDAYRLESGVVLSREPISSAHAHLRRRGDILQRRPDYQAQALAYRSLPLEKRQAIVKPWVDLKPVGAKKIVVFRAFLEEGNLNFEDVLGLSTKAEQLMEVSEASLPEPPLTLAERLAIGSYWYARDQYRNDNKSPIMRSFMKLDEVLDPKEQARVRPFIDLIRDKNVKKENGVVLTVDSWYTLRSFARAARFEKHFNIEPE